MWAIGFLRPNASSERGFEGQVFYSVSHQKCETHPSFFLFPSLCVCGGSAFPNPQSRPLCTHHFLVVLNCVSLCFCNQNYNMVTYCFWFFFTGKSRIPCQMERLEYKVSVVAALMLLLSSYSLIGFSTGTIHGSQRKTF